MYSLQVAANRTFNVLPIVEGVYDMGNLAAVTRSADGMGLPSLLCILLKAWLCLRCCHVLGELPHRKIAELLRSKPFLPSAAQPWALARCM